MSDAATKTPKNVYEFEVEAIGGKKVALKEYKGKVTLIVNTASKCGLTPQYKGLQEVYDKYKGKGFEILGFPSNDFMGQEPGTDAEIKDFCTNNYKISFPLFHKNKVKGDDKQPLYKFLVSNSPTDKDAEISWNFEKFLIAKDGTIAARFSPKTEPTDEKIIQKIESLLK
ncbi:MAG: glutathione peroxidase [Xanthomonadaceae bacterium]|nr:glutathione peroxidase [Xanthomonadaceae bacterium]